MNRSDRKALIIGCGVAGPVVALFLQRAGIEAEIYEARAASTEYGGSFLRFRDTYGSSSLANSPRNLRHMESISKNKQ